MSDHMEMQLEVGVSEWARLHQRVGYLEGLLEGLEFADLDTGVRDTLRDAMVQYKKLKQCSGSQAHD